MKLNLTVFLREGKAELHLQKCCAMRPGAVQLPAVQMDLDSDLTRAAGSCRRNKSKSGLVAMNNMMSLHPDLIVLILHGKYHMEVAD